MLRVLVAANGEPAHRHAWMQSQPLHSGRPQRGHFLVSSRLTAVAPVSSSLSRLSHNALVITRDHLFKELNNGDWQSYLVSLAPIAFAVGVSYQLSIDLEGEIQVAVIRSFVQMLAIGFLLKFLIVERAVWSFLVVFVMLMLAGSTAGEQAMNLPNSQVVATASLALGTLGSVVLLVLLNVFPLESNYLVIVTGHMLGNAMLMVGRTLKTLQHEIAQHRGQVEAALALGATPFTSVQEHMHRALTLGMAPMVDAIKVMGLVSLPGNLTGLLMGGVAPLEAVKTQIKVVNALLGAASISCLIALLLGWRMLFTSTSQLRDD